MWFNLLRPLPKAGLLEVDSLRTEEGLSLCVLFNGVAFFGIVSCRDRGVEVAVFDGVRFVFFEGVVVADVDGCRFVGVPAEPRIDTVLLVSDLSR
jgi:hypothetical protein